MPMKSFIPNKLKPWVEARQKYRLSHTQIQMARELGLNPKKFGSLGNTKIEEIYFKHFKKRAPENVRSIEQMVKDKARKKAESKARKKEAGASDEATIT